MPSFVLRSLGCKANFSDGQSIATELVRRGWHSAADGETPTVCVVNSCTVTDEADRQSRRLAARFKRLHPSTRVVVTGCAADVDPERLENSAGVDYVVGNIDKPRIVDLLLERLERSSQQGDDPAGTRTLGRAIGYSELRSAHPEDREWPAIEPAALPQGGLHGADRTRCFIKIQEGCNSFCTYCIIPYGRGPSRSLSPKEVIRAILDAEASGVGEAILTGTNLGDYGSDWDEESKQAPGEGFALLVGEILKSTSRIRIRLSSLDPQETRPELISWVEREPRLCSHFHVSLQSPHDRILRMMKRAYRSKDVSRTLERLAQVQGPHAPAFVGMDVITGFPGETIQDFEESYALLKELPWTRLHVFPYSEREGTPASRLPGVVPPSERARRASLLRELSLKRMEAHYSKAPRVVRGILLEKPDDSGIAGYTSDYLKVKFAPEAISSGLERGQLIAAHIHGMEVDPVAGEAVLRGTPLMEPGSPS